MPEYKHAVEYRSMHTALHHLLVFADGQQADAAFEALESEDEGRVQDAFAGAVDDFEIDYRQVEFDSDIRNWHWNDPFSGDVYIVENAAHRVPDVW